MQPLITVLASHPAVFGAGELSFVGDLTRGVGEYPGFVDGLPGEALGRLGADYVGTVQRRFGARMGAEHRFVVDKMPANFLYAGLIRLMLPDARIIHCRRDPGDTCLSSYSKLFKREQLFSYDQRELGRFHVDCQALMAHWRGVLPASHFIEVQYEDVVDDLEGQARRLVDFLGLDWSPACIKFYRTERAVRTASVNQVREPIYRGSVGRAGGGAEYLGPLLGALGVGD